MSSLKTQDKILLEKFLEMGAGYLCDFSDRTFGEFVLENAGVDVYTPEYSESGTSKAKRLRAFWKRESDELTSVLMESMIEYWHAQKIALGSLDDSLERLYQECLKIVVRLKSQNPVEDIDAFKINSPQEGFKILFKAIRESVEKGESNQALDRLHTLMMKYMRSLCKRHSLALKKDTRLNDLMRTYVKYLQEKGVIHAEMSKRILTSLASILDAFDLVRNDHSLAHDNEILNLDESYLILNTVAHIIRFTEAKEKELGKSSTSKEAKMDWEELEFTDEEIEAAGDVYIQSQIDIMRGK